MVAFGRATCISLSVSAMVLPVSIVSSMTSKFFESWRSCPKALISAGANCLLRSGFVSRPIFLNLILGLRGK